MAAARYVLLLLLGSTSALQLPTQTRRAALQHGLAAVASTWAVPFAAHADLGDLEAPEEAPVKMQAVKVDVAAPADEPFFAPLTMTDAGPKKKKEQTQGERIRELEKKGGDKSKKEISELRKLKADEMCEMLGRGC